MTPLKYATPRIRAADMAAAQSFADSFPTDLINVFTAQRLVWEQTPESKRIAALRQVAATRPKKGRPAKAS